MSKINKCAVFLILLVLLGIFAIILSLGYTFSNNAAKVSLSCDENEFKCTENGKCILKRFQCDGEIDCPYKSDEINCPIEEESYYEPDQQPDYETEYPRNRGKSDERPPKLKEVENQYVLIQGADFEQECELINGTSAKLVWSKRDAELPNNIEIHGHVLRISNITPENRGMYICEAENKLGSDQIEIFIEVEIREAPIMYIEPKKNIHTIKIGESARIYCCKKSGDPIPTITWKLRNNKELSSNIVILPGHPDIMTINSATIDDSGEYECHAQNVAGSFSITTKVEVIE